VIRVTDFIVKKAYPSQYLSASFKKEVNICLNRVKRVDKRLAAENPPTHMGVMVGGGASDAPSQLTLTQ
jgi:hypothetical protein